MSNYIPRPAEAQISAAEYAARRQKLMQAIGPNAIAIIPAATEKTRNSDVHYRFRQDSDFRYLTGFGEPDAWAVLAPGHDEGEFVLFCRPKDKLREIWDGYRAGPEGCKADYAADRAENIGDLDKIMPQLMQGREQVYFTLGADAHRDRRVLGWINSVRAMVRTGVTAPPSVTTLDSVLHEHRLRKSAAEIAMMRHAGTVSAHAHIRAMQKSKAGLYEYQLGAEIHHDFERHGMEPAYGSIVGGGANACVLHYVENAQPLQDGDICLIDAGAEFEGYCADITRSFPVNGRYTPAQKAVYEVVLAAQRAAIAEAKVGNDWMAPHHASVRCITEGLVELGLLKGSVDALIEEEKYSQFFMHKTGHWLGMDVHDVGAYRVDGQWRKLEAGMALTVEPGLYIAGDTEGVSEEFLNIGIRIEDDIVVTDKGPDNLTADVPKAVDDIEALMAD